MSDGNYWVVRTEVRSSIGTGTWVEERRYWIEGDPPNARDTAIGRAGADAQGEVVRVLSCAKGEVCAHE